MRAAHMPSPVSAGPRVEGTGTPAYGYVRGFSPIWHRVPWAAMEALPHHRYRVTSPSLCGAKPQPLDRTTAEWAYVAAFVGPEFRHCRRCAGSTEGSHA